MSILTIAGSPSADSRSAKLLAHVGNAIEAADLDVATLSLRSLPAEALLLADRSHPAIVAALDAVADASAIVLATPIYKAAYSGLLKTFLDLLPQRGFEGKFVWPIASGGSLAHALAIDYALRPVLASLSAAQIGRAVFALDSEIGSDSGGGLQLAPALAARLDDGVNALAQHLGAPPRLAKLNASNGFMRFSPARCSA